ncbi:MAG: SurA N-terminal domain-containing protein [Gammaproteobacteria bacterium]|nr:SurA N-terminal domain-containing protein [Gammaproteobacteria bacterium]MDH5591862.1 SurA N-terminal domain-containing protein [Gammaproteobacteria bacterium]
MLHFIRERAQGWVAWFIVGLISIPFALWGVNSYLNGPSDANVAIVDGEPIKQAEFQQAYQQYRDRMREVMADKFDPALFEGLAVKQTVLDSLIEKKLLLAANNELGQRVRDADVNNLIQSTQAFQNQGKFDPERYRIMLARISLDPARYESQLRQDMLTQELTNNIQRTTLVMPVTIDNVLRLEKQTRDIAYGVVSAQSQLDKVTVTDEDVRHFYDKNKQNYTTPEQIIVNYLELSIDGLSKAVEVDEASLQQLYIDNKDQFVGPEQRRASHILIEGDEQAALASFSTIKQRLDTGEDFATLAAEFSQDSGSSSEGGDLGLFQRGVMEPEFEKAVFSMKTVGNISEVVKTEFGYHLIKLTEIKTPESKSFADVRDQVESLYRLQKAEELFYEQAEQLADLSYESPDSLDVTAEALSLEVKTSGAFTRDGGSGIASDKKVVNVAFSEDVLVNDLNSAVIELSKSHLIVLHKNKHIEASQLPFESVAPAIREQLRFQRASDKAREHGETILSQLKSGEAVDSLFSKNDWQPAKPYSRDNKEVSAQVLQHAFSGAKPIGDANFTGFTATNGNYIIVNVTAVNDGNPADASQEDRDGLESYLSRISGESELQAFIDSLKTDADIEVIAQNLK